MIETYSFGKMIVKGKKYSSDLIIFPDRINSSWWRVSGHKLSMEDLKEVFEEKPEVLVVGTGAAGMMKVDEEVRHYAVENGITLIVEKTKNAVKSFNQNFKKKKTVGAFHLTC
ncbi:MAG: Mth938-like domain-containing protein [Candidatus Aminicenantales bacterium]